MKFSSCLLYIPNVYKSVKDNDELKKKLYLT